MAVTPIARLDATECCIKWERMLNEVVPQSVNPESLRLKTNGFLDSVRSPVNDIGGEISFTGTKEAPRSTNGRVLAQVQYRQQHCDSVQSTRDNACVPGTPDPDDALFAEIDIDCTASVKLTLHQTEFREICEDLNSRQARRMVDKLSDLTEFVSNDMASKFVAGFGNYFNPPGNPVVDSAVSPRSVKLFNDTDNLAPNAMAWAPVRNDYNRAGYRGQVIMAVGGQTMENYVQVKPQFSGDEDRTRDNSTNIFQNNISAWVDYEIDDTIIADGDSHIITWPAGAFKFIPYYLYDNSVNQRLDDPNLLRTTITPQGGFLKHDLTIRRNDCGDFDEFDIVMALDYGAFKIPDDAWNTSCGQQPNGCLNWIDECAAMVCADLKPA